jgi:hypothetical protein
MGFERGNRTLTGNKGATLWPFKRTSNGFDFKAPVCQDELLMHWFARCLMWLFWCDLWAADGPSLQCYLLCWLHIGPWVSVWPSRRHRLNRKTFLRGNKTNEVLGDERRVCLKMLCRGTGSQQIHQETCLPNENISDNFKWKALHLWCQVHL